MTIQDLLFNRYEVEASYTENKLTSTVSTSVTQLVSNNPNRLGLYFANMDSIDIVVAPTSSVDTDYGFPLLASGGSLFWEAKTDFILPSLEWYGIATSGSPKIYILELLQTNTSSKTPTEV